MPFELGRPLGIPSDPQFQTRVLLAALRLLETSSGPVLRDFPEDVPPRDDSMMGWACPINLADETANLSDTEKFLVALKGEMNRMRSWYDLGLKRRGRTTVGVSGVQPEGMADFLGGFLDGGIPDNPRDDLPLALVLKLAADDLKAFYLEAAMAEPGETAPTSAALLDWFWADTIAARVLRAVKNACERSTDQTLKMAGQRLIVPMTHAS